MRNWRDAVSRNLSRRYSFKSSISLGPASGDDVGDLGGVEELHGELRAEVLVAELGRVVFGHVLGRLGAVLGRVQPEPLGLNG